MVDSSLGLGQVRLFTYGTLMRGERAMYLLESASFLGVASTRAEFSLHDMGHFPALCRGGDTPVFGELYALNTGDLAAIDRYENCPELYERVSIPLASGVEAHTFILRPEFIGEAPVIVGGCWRSRHTAAESEG